MSYQIHITSAAERDILQAADYIEFVLKNPDSADNLLNIVNERISSLSDMPQRFRAADDPILANWNIHFITINNYIAFYIIDSNKKSVIVVRFLYRKSNWVSILRQGISTI